MSPQLPKAAAIARLNDRFRSSALIGLPVIPGAVFLTRGITDLSKEIVADIMRAVRSFDHFPEGDDPYGERDFGALDQEGVGKIFWKIDYYADDALESGSAAPEDPRRSYRILTIMLAEEY